MEWYELKELFTIERRERHYKKGVPQGNIMKVSSLVEGSFFYIKKKKGEDPTK